MHDAPPPGPPPAGEPPQTAAPSPAGSRGPGTAIAAWALLLGLLGGTLLVHHAPAAPPPLVAAAVAMPWLWLLALLPLVGFVAHDRRWFVLAPALLAASTFLGTWGRAWAGWAEPGEGAPLRVLSWNVQRLGWEDADAGPKLDCVSGRIAGADPDAVVLLEVSARDVARLAERLELDCAHTDYRGSGDAGHGGLAVCARGGRWRLARKGPRRFVEEHDWYYVFGELVRAGAPEDPDQAAPGDIFNLIGVHLQPYGGILGSHVSDVSEAQADETRALLGRVSRLRDPTVVAGDFNSARDAPVHVAMRGYLTDAFEQAGWGLGPTARAGGWLPLRIDYVYASEALAVKAAEQPPWTCSDHRPVLAELVLAR
jgi:endonuclease/exonuclease/phosphatase (EEP) superfamily protein YafD